MSDDKRKRSPALEQICQCHDDGENDEYLNCKYPKDANAYTCYACILSHDADKLVTMREEQAERDARVAVHACHVLVRLYANHIEHDEIIGSVEHALRRPFASKFAENALEWFDDDDKKAIIGNE